jgi:hypothetical protein
MSKIQNADQ